MKKSSPAPRSAHTSDRRRKTGPEIKPNRNVAERLAQEMSVIAEIGKIIGSTLDIDEVYERFSVEVQKLIPADRISVSIHSLQDDRVWIAYVSGTMVPERIEGETLPLKGSLNELLIQTRTGWLFLPESIEELARSYPTLVNTLCSYKPSSDVSYLGTPG
jgi:hypothetical protein